MMMPWHGNAFCITGPLWGEFTGNAELWCCFWWWPEQTFEETVELTVIWDTMAIMLCYRNVEFLFLFNIGLNACTFVQQHASLKKISKGWGRCSTALGNMWEIGSIVVGIIFNWLNKCIHSRLYMHFRFIRFCPCFPSLVVDWKLGFWGFL